LGLIDYYDVLGFKERRKRKNWRISGFGILSESFIIVPAYNEEVNIVFI
jgi:hypothetical protein